MDKYEYNLKLDQLKNLVAANDYSTAAEIANSINWKKVRNSKTLLMVADIYEHQKNYEACKEVLLQAYDHSSVGRNIVRRLAEVAILSKNVSEAEDYYHEFLAISPRDSQRYVIAYKISCLKKAPLTDRIAILEEFKEQEYMELWAYELAVLYSKAGMRDKCVETCDDLILWFGDGEFVEKALDLKRSFQPLTPSQEEKFQQFHSQKGMVELELPNRMEATVSAATGLPELTMTASTFNTENLQEELSRSMEQILNATQKETVRDTMDSIKKIVSDIPYLNGSEESKESSYMEREQISDEVDASLKADFQEYLEEEVDGQMTLPFMAPENEATASAQMSIEEVLADWEKTKRAAEAAIAAAEQKKLDMEKKQAMAEASDIMERLKLLFPVLTATPGEDLPLETQTVEAALLADEPLPTETQVVAPETIAPEAQEEPEVAPVIAPEEVEEVAEVAQEIPEVTLIEPEEVLEVSQEATPVIPEVAPVFAPEAEVTVADEVPVANAETVADEVPVADVTTAQEMVAPQEAVAPQETAESVDESFEDAFEPEVEKTLEEMMAALIEEEIAIAQEAVTETASAALPTEKISVPQMEQSEEPFAVDDATKEMPIITRGAFDDMEDGEQEEDDVQQLSLKISQMLARDNWEDDEPEAQAPIMPEAIAQEEVDEDPEMQETLLVDSILSELAMQEAEEAQASEEAAQVPEVEVPAEPEVTTEEAQLPDPAVPAEENEQLSLDSLVEAAEAAPFVAPQAAPIAEEPLPNVEEELEKMVASITRTMVENANVEVPVTGGMPVEERPVVQQTILPEIAMPEDVLEEDDASAQEQPLMKNGTPGVLTEQDMKELFTYFLPVPGMREQIEKVLTDAKLYKSNAITSLRGNLIVQGEEGCGKTVFATSLIKAIQKIVGNENAKIGKIRAEALNRRDFSEIVPKIAGGYLIVDKAGDLTVETAVSMSQIMERNTQGMVVLLEDDSEGIKKALSLDFGFAQKFTGKVKIPVFTIDELVDFGKSYATEMECVIDEMGVLAMYNRINNIQKLDHATTLAEVKDIVDQAIESAESGGLKKLFTKKYNENDYLILRETDFE